MSKEKEKAKPAKARQKISLYPLDFEETLERLLQVEPEGKVTKQPKPDKKSNKQTKK